MATRIATGVDIGSHSLKVVQLRQSGGLIEVLKAGMVELPAGPPAAEGASPEAAAKHSAELAKLLRNLLRSIKCRARSANTAVGGRRVVIRYSNLPFVPAWQLRMMMQYQIEGEAMGGAEQNAADYRPLNIPAAKDLRMMTGLAKNDAVLEQMLVLRAAGLKAHDVTLSALPLATTLSLARAEDDTVACLVHIGADNTDLVIQRGSSLYFARNITTGSKAFTEALRSELGLDFATAERLKLTQGNILPEPTPPRSPSPVALEGEQPPAEAPAPRPEPTAAQQRLSEVLRRAANALVAQIQVSISACRSATGLTNLRVDKLLLSGGGAQLPGLADFLSARLHLPVEMLESFAGIELGALPPDRRREVEAHQAHYATAVGLALEQLLPGSFHLSLLPKAVKDRRDFYSRRIYLWGAGILYATTLLTAIVSSFILTEMRRRQVDQMGAVVNKAELQLDEATRLRDQNAALSGELETLFHRLSASRRELELWSVMRRVTPPQIQVLKLETYSERASPYEKPRRELSLLEKLAKKDQPPPPRVLVIMGKVTLEAIRSEGRLIRNINVDTAQKMVRQYGEQLKESGLVDRLEIPMVPVQDNLEFRIELALKPGVL